MTREKMTQMLSETICVTTEEAQAALEASEWRLLDAAKLAQRARSRAAKAEAEQARRARETSFGDAVRGLVARFIRARDGESPKSASMSELQPDVLAPLMLMPAVYACR